MDVRVLGTVELVTAGGAVVDVGAPKRRAVLAVLALAANQVVDAGAFVDRVWGERPPTHARTALQGHVSALRKLLAPHDVRLTSRASGYELALPEDAVDALRFAGLVARARRRPVEDVEGVALLDAALELWRGPALTGASGSDYLDAAGARLTDERLGAVGELARRLVALDRFDEAARSLDAPLRVHPLREDLVATAMRALHRGGRRTEALELFARTDAALHQELGVRPSQQLVAEHATLLDEGTSRSVPVARSVPASDGAAPPRSTVGLPAGPPVPAQLPVRDVGFRGRTAELEHLVALCDDAQAPAVVVVHGGAGVGKTSLVTRLAHDIADRFPAGQLFVELRGFADRTIRHPDAVLVDLLAALGVAPDDAPEPGDRRAALFRSLVAGRRLLLVLDDARDEAQVRPLLAPGCLTLVTSRHRMDGLVVHAGAALVELDVLGPDEATALLVGALGARVVDPADVRALAEPCGGHALALRLAAAALVTHPSWTVRAVADALHDEDQRTGLLVTAEGAMGESLARTAATLPDDTRRALHLLGLHPGPVIDRYLAAALIGGTPATARRHLEALARVGLVVEGLPGRWTRHDLVRLYGRHMLHDDPDRPVAAQRQLDYYLHAVDAARRALAPDRPPDDADDADDAVGGTGPPEVPTLDDEDAARRWVREEETVVLAVVTAGERSGDAGLRSRARRLAERLSAVAPVRPRLREARAR